MYLSLNLTVCITVNCIFLKNSDILAELCVAYNWLLTETRCDDHRKFQCASSSGTIVDLLQKTGTTQISLLVYNPHKDKAEEKAFIYQLPYILNSSFHVSKAVCSFMYKSQNYTYSSFLTHF